MLAPPVTLGQLNPVDHVVNHPFLTWGPWWVWSSHVGNLILTGLIMIVLIPYLSSCVGSGPASMGNARYLPRNRFAHMFEIICIYLRDTFVRPVLHEHTDRFMPFLWTLFFFVLINNLLGLVPVLEIVHLIFGGLRVEHRSFLGGTATGNLWVTGALALVSLGVYVSWGLRDLGPRGFIAHMTAGAPWYVWPIIVPIELIGTFIIKPGALAIRLFANMTAGHVLLATLFMFVAMAVHALPLWGAAPISLVSVLGSAGIYLLELFVAVLQAFIFMFLTAVFAAQLTHHDTHHHEPAPAAQAAG